MYSIAAVTDDRMHKRKQNKLGSSRCARDACEGKSSHLSSPNQLCKSSLCFTTSITTIVMASALPPSRLQAHPPGNSMENHALQLFQRLRLWPSFRPQWAPGLEGEDFEPDPRRSPHASRVRHARPSRCSPPSPDRTLAAPNGWCCPGWRPQVSANSFATRNQSSVAGWSNRRIEESPSAVRSRHSLVPHVSSILAETPKWQLCALWNSITALKKMLLITVGSKWNS